MVAYRKRSYRKKSSTKRRVYKRKSAPKATFAKRVKTVISRMAENKTQNFRAGMNLYHYTAPNWGLSVVPCTPDTLFLSIQQGVGQGDRIGNSIKVKSLKLTGVVRPLPYSATTNPEPSPLYLKLFFLTRKDNPANIFPNLGDLFQYGNSAESPGNSTLLQNMNRQINTDSWMVHTTRTFKLGYANYGGTGGSLDSQLHANNDFKLNHFINVDLTKYCVKTLKFNDNTTDPNTRNIVMYPVIYTANGANLANNSITARMEYALDIVYEDM